MMPRRERPGPAEPAPSRAPGRPESEALDERRPSAALERPEADSGPAEEAARPTRDALMDCYNG